MTRLPVAAPASHPEAKKLVQPQTAAQARHASTDPPVYRPQPKQIVPHQITVSTQAPEPLKPAPLSRPEPKPLQPKRATHLHAPGVAVGRQTNLSRPTQASTMIQRKLLAGVKGTNAAPRPSPSPGRAGIIQRMKLADFQITNPVEFKKFQTSKIVNCPYYIFIPSAKKGWHLTIPVSQNLKTTDEINNYVFYEYHVTEEGVSDNVHYHYDAKHKQDHTDVLMGTIKWKEADAVVREIFKVNPVPKYTWVQTHRLKLIENQQFNDIRKFDQAIKLTAQKLELTPGEVEIALNQENMRENMMGFVQEYL